MTDAKQYGRSPPAPKRGRVVVVALIGPTSASEIDLFGRGEKVVSDFDCAPCYLGRCDKAITCMEALDAQTVFEAVMRQIDLHDKEQRG